MIGTRLRKERTVIPVLAAILLLLPGQLLAESAEGKTPNAVEDHLLQDLLKSYRGNLAAVEYDGATHVDMFLFRKPPGVTSLYYTNDGDGNMRNIVSDIETIQELHVTARTDAGQLVRFESPAYDVRAQSNGGIYVVLPQTNLSDLEVDFKIRFADGSTISQDDVAGLTFRNMGHAPQGTTPSDDPFTTMGANDVVWGGTGLSHDSGADQFVTCCADHNSESYGEILADGQAEMMRGKGCDSSGAWAYARNLNWQELPDVGDDVWDFYVQGCCDWTVDARTSYGTATATVYLRLYDDTGTTHSWTMWDCYVATTGTCGDSGTDMDEWGSVHFAGATTGVSYYPGLYIDTSASCGSTCDSRGLVDLYHIEKWELFHYDNNFT